MPTLEVYAGTKAESLSKEFHECHINPDGIRLHYFLNKLEKLEWVEEEELMSHYMRGQRGDKSEDLARSASL